MALLYSFYYGYIFDCFFFLTGFAAITKLSIILGIEVSQGYFFLFFNHFLEYLLNFLSHAIF